MSAAAIVAEQTRAAVKTTLRTPRTVVFTLAFPVVLLVLFNSIFISSTHKPIDLNGVLISPASYFTAGLAAYSLALSAFTATAVTITTKRELGELKRMRGTPMPPWTFIAAQITRATLQSAAATAVLIGIGAAAYGVSVPAGNIPSIALYVVLGTATMSALGIALTSVTPTPDAVSAIAPFAVVLLSFFSGIWIPIDQLSSGLQTLGHIFPLSHIAEGLQRSLAANAPDHGLDGSAILALVIWALVGASIATRRFRWEPQGRG